MYFIGQYIFYSFCLKWIIHCNEPSIISWTECFQLKNRSGLKTYAFIEILALYIFTSHGQQVYVIEICFHGSHRDQILLEDYHKPNPDQEHLINVRRRKKIQKSQKFLPREIWGSDELHWMNGGHHQGNHLCWHNQVSSRTFKMSWPTSRNNQIKVKKYFKQRVLKI